MRVFRGLSEWRAWRASIDADIGFVPTLGGLHEGHAALIRRARAENPVCLVSLFLNPTQFNNPDDLAAYPADADADLALARALDADAVLMPNAEAIHADDYRFSITESPQSETLCGAHRPGHFTGVLTVVMKLLNLARPTRAYLGEKDWQQLQLVRDMCQAFFLDVDIVACPTVRDRDGLALSSRNARLGSEARRLAPELYRLLGSDLSDAAVAQALTDAGFDVDYVSTQANRRLAAASLDGEGGPVRLIDNLPVTKQNS